MMGGGIFGFFDLIFLLFRHINRNFVFKKAIIFQISNFKNHISAKSRQNIKGFHF